VEKNEGRGRGGKIKEFKKGGKMSGKGVRTGRRRKRKKKKRGGIARGGVGFGGAT